MIPDWMVGAPHPFDSVLVANRGEIAVRVLRAASEAGLRGVAVYSDPDEGALHVEVADEAVHLPGETLGETYLNSEAIIQAAKNSGAQAIHPGYGFLSERADFARMVVAAGLVWIGPPAESIETMGDKISARRRMIDSGVPVIPGEELAISEDADHLGTLAAAAARVGYPLLIKASAGGGGKGMRAVHEPRMLRTEYEAAAREASAAFGDGTVYVERLLTGARHVEIQVLCDSYGNAIHLNERDCSLQRRHQKVLEEAPSPAVTPLIRAAMGETAVQAAQSVDYEGVGTVEFLLSSGGYFFFL
jgi:geranyl-CoA carboxylase alpha subunit